MNRNISDVLFRILFSLIFLGLGCEHLFSDSLIQAMMPSWMPIKRLVSFMSGSILLSGGFMILVGYNVKVAAIILGSFVFIVTIVIHLPAVLLPITIPKDWQWLWDVYQRSNLVKNMCLIGVCFHLLHHKVGKYSLEYYVINRSIGSQN